MEYSPLFALLLLIFLCLMAIIGHICTLDNIECKEMQNDFKQTKSFLQKKYIKNLLETCSYKTIETEEKGCYRLVIWQLGGQSIEVKLNMETKLTYQNKEVKLNLLKELSSEKCLRILLKDPSDRPKIYLND